MRAPHIHAGGAHRPALQTAIREASGGGAHIQQLTSLHRYVETIEKAFQFVAAPAYEARRLLHLERQVGGHRSPGFVEPFAGAVYLAREDQRFGLRAGDRQAARQKQFIEPDLFR